MTTTLIGILLLVVLAVTALASWGLLAWLALPGRPGRAAPRPPEDGSATGERTGSAPGGSGRADPGWPEPRWMGFR